MARRRNPKQYGDVATHLKEQLKQPSFRKEWDQVQADMALATELIRLRTEQGLTQAQVAEMVNSTQSALSRLECNPPRRPTPLLKRLASMYGRELRVDIRLVPTGDGDCAAHRLAKHPRLKRKGARSGPNRIPVIAV